LSKFTVVSQSTGPLIYHKLTAHHTLTLMSCEATSWPAWWITEHQYPLFWLPTKCVQKVKIHHM